MRLLSTAPMTFEKRQYCEGAQGFWASDDALWARQMYLTSILMVTLLSLMLVVNAYV